MTRMMMLAGAEDWRQYGEPADTLLVLGIPDEWMAEHGLTTPAVPIAMLRAFIAGWDDRQAPETEGRAVPASAHVADMIIYFSDTDGLTDEMAAEWLMLITEETAIRGWQSHIVILPGDEAAPRPSHGGSYQEFDAWKSARDAAGEATTVGDAMRTFEWRSIETLCAWFRQHRTEHGYRPVAGRPEYTPACPACGSPEPDCEPGCPAVPPRETGVSMTDAVNRLYDAWRAVRQAGNTNSEALIATWDAEADSGREPRPPEGDEGEEEGEMGVLDTAASRLTGGAESVRFRPRGQSMIPLVRSGELVTVYRLRDRSTLEPGQVVLVTVRGKVYLHKVISVDREREIVLIGNNHGHVNGWTQFAYVHGIKLTVEQAVTAGRRTS